MDEVALAFAKLAGIRRAVSEALAQTKGVGDRAPRWPHIDVAAYFIQSAGHIATLRAQLPALYGDFIFPEPGGDIILTDGSASYSERRMHGLLRGIDQALELRSNSGGGIIVSGTKAAKVFITHGRPLDWQQVQLHIEKDLGLPTKELAQQPNLGRTIIEKLEGETDDCTYAVIVMTGDDVTDLGEIRARENVMHEIGFFHGKYGRANVCLLHEDGVNVPTNLAGIVYAPFTKGSVSSAFHLLAREIRAHKP